MGRSGGWPLFFFLSFIYISSCYSESSIVLAAETLPYVASLEKQCLMLSGVDMFIFLRTRRIQQQKGELIEWRLRACRNLRRYVKKRKEIPTLFPLSSWLPVDAIYCRGIDRNHHLFVEPSSACLSRCKAFIFLHWGRGAKGSALRSCHVDRKKKGK